MKSLLNSPLFRRTTDLVLSPLTFIGAIWQKFIRTGTARQMPVSEKIFMAVGVLPIRDQYYQPLINPGKYLKKPLNEPRSLPGIEWNLDEQKALLNGFCYQEEVLAIPFSKTDAPEFGYYYDNPSLCPTDAEFCYNIIRHFKPRRMIEVGCGYSTLLAMRAHT